MGELKHPTIIVFRSFDEQYGSSPFSHLSHPMVRVRVGLELRLGLELGLRLG